MRKLQLSTNNWPYLINSIIATTKDEQEMVGLCVLSNCDNVDDFE